MTRCLVSMSILFVALSGCEKEAEAPAAAQPGTMPPDHPAGAANLPSMPTASGLPALPAGPSGTIHGRIELAAAVADRVEAGDPIFVMARNAATGSIIAVARVTAPETFPVSFSLTGEDVMHRQTTLTGKIRLEARLDKDGDAITKKPGDLVGQVEGFVLVPARDVVLTLERAL